MRHAITVLAIALPVLVSGPARAQITIHNAEYAAGVLVVRGEASKPNQVLTLDDRYKTTAGRNKDFTFRIRYLPRDCMVEIEAGEVTHPVMVANCTAATDPQAPAHAKADRKNIGEARETYSRDKDRSGDRAQPRDDAGAEAAIRVVRQPCETGQECRVTCRQDEFAINAFCPAGSAELVSERTVSCGADAAANIVAYCALPAADN